MIINYLKNKNIINFLNELSKIELLLPFNYIIDHQNQSGFII